VEPDRRRLLLLEVQPASGVDPERAQPIFVLSSEISGLDLSFLTPAGWQEDYAPSSWSGLPAAVRLRIYRDGTLIAARTVQIPLAASHPARSAGR
jgi:hypothetical protein